MAFNKNLWTRQTLAFNSGKVPTQDGGPENGPAIFTYYNPDDTLATISGANYFTTQVWDLSLQDVIWCQGSDANGFYVVTSLNRAAGTVSLTAQTGGGGGSGDALIADVQTLAYNQGEDTGVADAYIVDLTPAISGITPGLIIQFIPGSTNTLPNPTLTVNGFTDTISLSSPQYHQDYLLPGDISSGVTCWVIYTQATGFMLLNPLVSSFSSSKCILGDGYTASASGTADDINLQLDNLSDVDVLNLGINKGKIFGFTPISDNGTNNPLLSVNNSPSHAIVNSAGDPINLGDIKTDNTALVMKNDSGWTLLNPYYLSSKYIQRGYYNFGIDSGVADAYVVACDPPITTYYEGMIICFQALEANLTSSVTVDAGAGAIAVYNINGQGLLTGDIYTGLSVWMLYINGSFLIMNPALSYITSAQVLRNYVSYGYDSGAADAYEVALNIPVAVTDVGSQVSFIPTNDNLTTTPTLEVNGTGGALPIVLSNGAVQVGDLATTMIAVCVLAPGNKWVLTTPAVS